MSLDASMVRVFMAQSALPHLRGRVVASVGPSCETPKFCVGEDGFTPSLKHRCESCRRWFGAGGRVRKTIANPVPAILARLARLADLAPRRPQTHDMALLPETP